MTREQWKAWILRGTATLFEAVLLSEGYDPDNSMPGVGLGITIPSSLRFSINRAIEAGRVPIRELNPTDTWKSKVSIAEYVAWAIGEGLCFPERLLRNVRGEFETAPSNPSQRELHIHVDSFGRDERQPKSEPEEQSFHPPASVADIKENLGRRGVPKREIVEVDWPLLEKPVKGKRFTNESLKNALSDVPEWLKEARAHVGAPGKESSLWNPALIAVCLVDKGYSRQEALTEKEGHCNP